MSEAVCVWFMLCALLLQFAMEDIEAHTIAEWSGW